MYLCLLSLHKKVAAVWSAQLHKVEGLLKLWFETECIYSILLPSPNGSLQKLKVSLWAYAIHLCASFKLVTLMVQRRAAKSVKFGLAL